jgi:hypothetical protein
MTNNSEPTCLWQRVEVLTGFKELGNFKAEEREQADPDFNSLLDKLLMISPH